MGVVGGSGEVVECVMVVGDDDLVEDLEEESVGLVNNHRSVIPRS